MTMLFEIEEQSYWPRPTDTCLKFLLLLLFPPSVYSIHLYLNCIEKGSESFETSQIFAFFLIFSSSSPVPIQVLFRHVLISEIPADPAASFDVAGMKLT